MVQANFILVLGNTFEERWALEWWDGFAKLERYGFERGAQDFVGRLAILRRIVADVAAAGHDNFSRSA